MRVLLIEDDQMLGDALRHYLKQEGITTDWVRDTEEAELVSVRKHNFLNLLPNS